MTGMGNAALTVLQGAGIDVAAVVTDPAPGPGFPHYPCEDLIALCGELRIPVWTDVRLRDQAALRRIIACQPDAVLVATSRKIIPDELVQRLDGRVINCHPSLLPRHRGPTPIPWTIEHGECETGLTFVQPTAELDAGPLWFQCRTPIDPEETTGELRYRLDQVLLPQTLPNVVRGVVSRRLTPTPQTGPASYEHRFQDCVGDVEWAAMPAVACLRRFRARTPFPGAFVEFQGRRYQLMRLRSTGAPPQSPPGTVRMNHLGMLVIDVDDGELIGTAVYREP